MLVDARDLLEWHNAIGIDSDDRVRHELLDIRPFVRRTRRNQNHVALLQHPADPALNVLTAEAL
jgi:hypothetical protein